MCYSAQIHADYKKFVRMFGATMSIKEFYETFWKRTTENAKMKIPKALEAAFEQPESAAEQHIKDAIDAFKSQEATRLETDLFKQRKRLADAERTLQTKTTKAATESKRIASDKIAWGLDKLADLRRTQLEPRDSRIFPGWFAPIMVMEEGRLVVKPMRYQCRPCGKPAFFDSKFPGTYNARRDNLDGFWKELWGYSHGVMLASAFFENVKRHRMEGRELAEGEPEENVILQFKPQGMTDDMLVACLWSHWKAPGQPDLLSFAAITDEPPPEVAAAGHDRCIIPLKRENLEEWLNPKATSLARQYEILDDRERPYYEYRMAA
jgi:putative SOS response-associated peptidase YedK